MKIKFYVLVGTTEDGEKFTCQFDPDKDRTTVTTDIDQAEKLREELQRKFPNIQYKIYRLKKV